jgi:hypothetical protein
MMVNHPSGESQVQDLRPVIGIGPFSRFAKLSFFVPEDHHQVKMAGLRERRGTNTLLQKAKSATIDFDDAGANSSS